jgi:hypothetical protein
MADAGATENHDDAQPQPQTDRIRSLSISLEPLRDYELAPPAAMHKQIWNLRIFQPGSARLSKKRRALASANARSARYCGGEAPSAPVFEFLALE